MQAMSASDVIPQEIIVERTHVLFREDQDSIYQRTDRLFAKLMVLQWLAGIAAALWISPKTWIGASSQTHWHVWAAIFLGGMITSFPVFLAYKQPGSALTRHVIAVAQMLTSALLIHLTGGRIETHFHVFGSLAFLAFYRDWRVLTTATVVVAADHLMRGLFWPQSVFGVLTASPWRWIEHAGWVLFEDTFLLISIRQSVKEMFEAAARRANLEAINQQVEGCVEKRTAELQMEIQDRVDMQLKLEETHKQLLETSRQAGMAEVATGVLHNVGNVLNSVNVSSTVVADNVRRSKAANLSKVVALLREHEKDLGVFMTNDPKGQQLPGYLAQLAEHLASEQTTTLEELALLQKNIEHIKDIVAMQQSISKVSGVTETIKISELMEDVLRMNASALASQNIKIIREFEAVPPITTEKHKVLQILANLVCNAEQACVESSQTEKRLTLHIGKENQRVRIGVSDNGVGISQKNLARIFAHGFTTKKDGHGFGLHSAALAAKEMGGSLTVQSEGTGTGATFTLELPLDSKKNPSGKSNQ